MSQEANDERYDKRTEGPESGAKQCCPGGSEGFEGFEGDMKEMMQACPCKDWMKSHRLAVYGTLAGIGLTVLIVQVGWVLGVIGFFRTF